MVSEKEKIVTVSGQWSKFFNKFLKVNNLKNFYFNLKTICKKDLKYFLTSKIT
jgi:hypothetical protein